MNSVEIGLIVAVVLLAIVVVLWWLERGEAISEGVRADFAIADLERAMARLRDVEPREARFRQALGYYSDESTWASPKVDNDIRKKHSPAFRDRGKLAREALK
jgi:hypothetical protein